MSFCLTFLHTVAYSLLKLTSNRCIYDLHYRVHQIDITFNIVVPFIFVSFV